jgi:hypothetical protein
MADESPARRRVLVANSQRAFSGLWGAISALTRGRALGSPLDLLRAARIPGQRLLGGSYRAGSHPVWVGPGKCRKKGHHPIPKRLTEGKLIEAWMSKVEISAMRADNCARCQPGWDLGFHDRRDA